MARHGENIRKRKDGRWEGRYPVYSMEKERKVYRSVYGRTYEEVREKLTIQKDLVKNGGIISDTETKLQPQILLKDIMLTDMLQEWLAAIKEKRKPSTYVKYSLICRNHLERNFENITIAEITNSLVREKISDTLSESVQKSIYCVLNQVLKYASIQYSVKISALERPFQGTKSRPVKVLSKKEQKMLIFVLYQEMNLFKMAILLCLFTGLRLGELCALKWKDIDFENKILTINRTVQRLYVNDHKTKTTLVETTPKSECSRREIPLTDSLLELLLKFGTNKEYIFGGDKPMEPRTMQYHFKKIQKDINLQNQNFHILRHTFSTNCIEGGVDVKSLSEILGHSDVKITLNRYVHPSMDTKRQYMNTPSRFYGQIYGQTG
ncbi:MAG: site-specific integrase [Lachnospiraceae bacterium]|nr:site-specific integrase [Lachnospiraceae bacterium]